MNKEKILGCTPYIEMLVRRLYYSENILSRIIKKILKTKSKAEEKSEIKDLSKDIFNHIETLGVERGDILIVHSSMDELNKCGINAAQLLDFLLGLVGEEGTLVIPAFPLYNKRNYSEERNMHIYDAKRTVSSTGMLSNIFLRKQGVIRSEFPWNTLAAYGSEAERMMMNNLETDLAHGKGSSWEFCVKNRAKILFLGVSASHTTSILHVIEDVLDEQWPISDWYEEKTVYLSNNNPQEFTFRIRKEKWAKYIISWYRSNVLKKKNILLEKSVCGTNIGYVNDSKEMIAYIMENMEKKKIFFSVPKQLYK